MTGTGNRDGMRDMCSGLSKREKAEKKVKVLLLLTGGRQRPEVGAHVCRVMMSKTGYSSIALNSLTRK